ncbi:hypothetical protein CSQ92_18495 [Janthinobacterium sp. BJB446]|nr:hypothetical protein CSQ92_18495 [Janthinobacterium sp. BJB446]
MINILLYCFFLLYFFVTVKRNLYFIYFFYEFIDAIFLHNFIHESNNIFVESACFPYHCKRPAYYFFFKRSAYHMHVDSTIMFHKDSWHFVDFWIFWVHK